jgi:hypothetical protein
MRVVARSLALASEDLVNLTREEYRLREGLRIDRLIEKGPTHASPWPFRILILLGLAVAGWIAYQIVPMLLGDVTAVLSALGS